MEHLASQKYPSRDVGHGCYDMARPGKFGNASSGPSQNAGYVVQARSQTSDQGVSKSKGWRLGRGCHCDLHRRERGLCLLPRKIVNILSPKGAFWWISDVF